MRRWRELFSPHRVASVALILGLAAFAIFFVTIDRTPLPWFDEILFASASRSATTVPTVLGAFESGRFELFYGPLGSFLGRAAFDAFGFSAASFRLVSLLGAILIASSAWALVRSLGGSHQLAALAFLAVAISPEIGASATNGRFDTVTVGLLLAGVAFYVRTDRSWWLAGPAWTLAILSTPRTLPFMAAFFGSALLLDRFRGLARIMTVGLTILVGVSIWTLSENMTPLAWLQHISAVSGGDPVNTSPVLGGAWTLNISFRNAITLLFACLLLPSVAPIRRETKVVLVAMALNSAVTLVMLGRPFSYAIFWSLPLLIAALASIHRRFTSVVVVALMLLVFAAVRIAKTAEVVASWEARDPAIVEEFVRNTIPPGSTVYGPESYFYYAVERSGSQYRFVEELMATGMRSQPGVAPEFVPGYLLWPDQQQLPETFRLRPLASYTAPSPSRFFKRLNPYSGGYPSFTLYEAIP